MLSFYKSLNGSILKTEELCDGCWIHVANPSEAETSFLINGLHIDPDFVRASLDEEESSRIENEENQTLVIIDTPIEVEDEKQTIPYSTLPMGIIITDKYIVTVCVRENPIITEFTNGQVRNIHTHLKTRLLLMILLRIAAKFLFYLKLIDKKSNTIENKLQKSMRNKELIELRGLEKSLVFFSTSLKSNEITLEKILRGRIIKLYEEDQDLLEDVLIEVKQAIEMANIYSSILAGTMNTFASVISNNLNIVMKGLTSSTVILSIPDIVTGFYGMNVDGLPVPHVWFPSLLITIFVGIVAIFLNRRHML